MTLLHAGHVIGVLIRHSEGRSVVRVVGMHVRNAKKGRRIRVEIEAEIHVGTCRLETSWLRGVGG